jgi:hypothetical protein
LMIDDKSSGPTEKEIAPIGEGGWKGLN